METLNPESLKAIAKRLVTLREALEFKTQLAFATRCGITQTAYNNYERGIRRVSLDEAKKISRATGATLDWIYEGDPSGLPLHLAEKLRA